MKPSAEQQAAFDNWLDACLSEDFPTDVVAFAFNLSEPWMIELVGTSQFDPTDSDWACEEVFRPATKPLKLDAFGDDAQWEDVLAHSKLMLLTYLEANSSGSATLKRSQGIGLGFVDGDLEILSQE